MQHSPQGFIAEQDSLKVEKAAATLQQNDADFVRVYANGDPYFGLWLALVDAKIRFFAGISVSDLEDWMSHDAYEAGMTPREGAIEALSNDDLYAHHLDELGIN